MELIAFRENGQGYTAMTTFCRCINMPPPMAQTTFDDLNSDLHNAYCKLPKNQWRSCKNCNNNLTNIKTNTT